MKCNRLDFLEVSREILTRGARVRFQAHGGSMHPFIKNGDILEVEPVDKQKISLGDIIFYHAADRHMAVHRVIKKFFQNDKPVFITKGDSIIDCQEKVFLEEILGRVVGIERNGLKIRFNSGLSKFLNLFYAKLSPFSKWLYPPLRKIKHSIEKIRERYASRKLIDKLVRRSKY